MNGVKKIGRIAFGSVVTVSLMVPAFQVGALVGLGYLLSTAISVYNGDWIDNPGLPILDFIEETVSSVF